MLRANVNINVAKKMITAWAFLYVCIPYTEPFIQLAEWV